MTLMDTFISGANGQSEGYVVENNSLGRGKVELRGKELR